MNAYHISLSGPEEETLKQMYHFAPKRRLRERAHMVLLSQRGYCQKEVATIAGVSYPTARRFIHGYDVYGIAALYDEEKPGRPTQMSVKIQHSVDTVLSHSPREVGYNQSNWTSRLLGYHLKKNYGIQLSGESVRRWIHRLGYSLLRPRHQSQMIDPERKKKPKAI